VGYPGARPGLGMAASATGAVRNAVIDNAVIDDGLQLRSSGTSFGARGDNASEKPASAQQARVYGERRQDGQR